MRVQVAILVDALEKLGFVQESRTDRNDPYRLVWPEDPVETLIIKANKEGMVGLQFIMDDVKGIDPELPDALHDMLRREAGPQPYG